MRWLIISFMLVSCLPEPRVIEPPVSPKILVTSPEKQVTLPTPSPTPACEPQESEIVRLKEEADLYRSQRDEYMTRPCECEDYSEAL